MTGGRRSTQRSKILFCLILNGTIANGGKETPKTDQLFLAFWCLVRRIFLLFLSIYLFFSIDASCEDGSLGRLVNDAHKSPNCKMKKLQVHSKPHLCLFAIEDIETGTEITYNYGNSEWPWRVLVSKYSFRCFSKRLFSGCQGLSQFVKV